MVEVFTLTISALRKKKGVTVISFSQLVDLSAVYVYNVLGGASIPSIGTLNKMLAALGVGETGQENVEERIRAYEEWLSLQLDKFERGSRTTPVKDAVDVLTFLHAHGRWPVASAEAPTPAVSADVQ